MNARVDSPVFRARVGAATVLVAIGAVAVWPTTSEAQTPPTRKPNIFLVVDSSTDMRTTPDGATADCSTGDKSKYVILAETLTGSISSGLECSSSVAIESNKCRPTLNGRTVVRSRLSSDPDSWPVATNGPAWARDAIVFCGKHGNYATKCGRESFGNWNNGEVCKPKKNGGNEWDQVDDGLLDTFATQYRFGMASFDGTTNTGNFLPCMYSPLNANGNLLCGGPADCQMGVTGSRCFFDSNRQFSYWYQSSGEWWGNGSRSSYSEQIWTIDPGGPTDIFTPEAALGGNIDMGIRNSRARPYEGRLIGFGPGTWNTTTPAVTGCNSEDTCTSVHNDMVQRSVLGLAASQSGSNALTQSRPTAAALRDAAEFMLGDDQTKGVYLPHPENVDPDSYTALKGLIGPQQDTDVSTGCRTQSVVLLAGGPPKDDIYKKPGYYANTLLSASNSVQTFAVGLVPTKVNWADAVPSTAASQHTTICSEIVAADFTSGVCEPLVPGSLKFKYAEPPYDGDSFVQAEQLKTCCTLAATAMDGGTGSAYFAPTTSDLKRAMNSIMARVGGGVISRTIPVFAPTSTTYNKQANPAPNAPAAYFEIRTSAQFTSNDTIWRGNIERIRYSCSGTSQPVPVAVNNTAGDGFSANADLAPTGANVKRYFTVIPIDATGPQTEATMLGTIRAGGAGANAQDGLYQPGGLVGSFATTPITTVADTSAATMDALETEINSLTGTTHYSAAEALGISGADVSTCQSTAQTNSVNTCTERVLRWFTGVAAPNGTSMPSRIPTSAACTAFHPGNACSPIGGIYKSTPIVVPPPEPGDSDDQSFSATRSGGVSNSFVQDYITRPTMVYQQTTDGILHAFVLSMNDFDGTAPDFDSGASPSIQVVDQARNNELWSFIPPAILPTILPNFDTQTRLMDGQLTWANVIPNRPLNKNGGVSSTASSLFGYRTVMVAASGSSALGGLYYALDITDPTSPQFLWQMSFAGNADTPLDKGEPGDRLFGKSAPGALITHIRYREQSGDEAILAVAVLPGGDSAAATPVGSPINRQDATLSYWSGTNRKPRTKIRPWGTTGDPARSLTFVELTTGRILARLTGYAADNPINPSSGANDLLDPYVTKTVKFDSPITGIPVAYPEGVGAVADRIYVGDADGTLWRVDLTDGTSATPVPGDPSKWVTRIAFDAYNTGSSGAATLNDAWVGTSADYGDSVNGALGPISLNAAALMGQPIQTAPLLSLDEIGNVVVTFSTGDQESFNTVSNGMVNLVVSFADEFDQASGKFAPAIDSTSGRGVEVAFLNGGLATGPLNLFDGQLYYSYFEPATSGCNFGTGGLCSYGYNSNSSFAPTGPGLDLDDVDAVKNNCELFAGGQVVFGVSINLVPSCEVAQQNFSDPWMAGSYSTSQQNVGSYQLSYATGIGSGPGSFLDGSASPSERIDLPTPTSKTKVRTWVSVVE